MSDTNGSNPYGDPIDPGQPNNPDPYGGAPQSNPYGAPAADPSQQPTTPPPAPPNPYAAPPAGGPYAPPPNPYAAPPAAPYGQGGGSPYGQPSGPTKTDGMAIGALVASVIGLCTCIGSVVGIVLGFIAMGRTREGRVGGRGLAISAVALGFVGVVLWIAGVIGLVAFVASQSVTPGNAKPGQCVNIDNHSDNKIAMTKADCSKEHDGQVIAVATADSDNPSSREVSALCGTAAGPANLAKLNTAPEANDLQLNWAADDPNNVSAGDKILCYVEYDNNLRRDLLK